MSKLPNLVWLRSFESAARHLSFTQAAEELGLTQTALSLHVRSLEATLGCKLFTRNARKLTLTEVGQAYAFSLRRSLGDIALSTASLFGTEGAQVLTVRVPISTASLWLTHRLPEFVAAHPGISVRIVSNIWAESLGQDDVDVEIRLGRGGWTGLAHKKISTERIVPIAPVGFAGAVAELLREGPLVRILGYEDMTQAYLNACGLTELRPVFPYSVDTTIAAMDIVAAGGGCAVVLERFADAEMARGRAIAKTGEAMPIEQGHYLVGVSPPEVNDTAKQLFEAWLEGIFAA